MISNLASNSVGMHARVMIMRTLNPHEPRMKVWERCRTISNSSRGQIWHCTCLSDKLRLPGAYTYKTSMRCNKQATPGTKPMNKSVIPMTSDLHDRT
jgi:hypothetical protein